ncbi:MAG TPA: energy transducer TonB [Pyrinomonadaceae bacterium]|jgi:hypothetical protein
MKKFLFPAFLIALFLTTVYSQNEIQKSDWRTFQPLQEEFSAEFPQNVVDKSGFDEKGVLKKGFYRVLFNKTYFFVHSGEEKTFVIPDLVKEFMRAHKPLESSRNIGEFSGVVYKFRDDEDFYHQFFEIKARRRSYIFHTIGEIKEDFEVERFFDSIKFVDPSVEKTESQIIDKTVAPEDTNILVTHYKSAPVNGIGSGSGIGNGIGTVDGRSLPNPAGPVQPNQTSPLKILSKPRADYTDLARVYQISGAVRVRITFQADGAIGAVAPFTKLPLGLTKNAIEAARRMRFEPAASDGKAIDAVKIVEYTFMIY